VDFCGAVDGDLLALSERSQRLCGPALITRVRRGSRVLRELRRGVWLAGQGGEGGGDGGEVGFDVGGGGCVLVVGVAGVGAGDAVAKVAFDPGEGGVA
jgi:hypothetical protein